MKHISYKRRCRHGAFELSLRRPKACNSWLRTLLAPKSAAAREVDKESCTDEGWIEEERMTEEKPGASEGLRKAFKAEIEEKWMRKVMKMA